MSDVIEVKDVEEFEFMQKHMAQSMNALLGQTYAIDAGEYIRLVRGFVAEWNKRHGIANDEITRLRSINAELVEALARLERDLGHNEDTGNPAVTACEYCGSQSEPHSIEIEHDEECRIYKARSVLAKARGTE